VVPGVVGSSPIFHPKEPGRPVFFRDKKEAGTSTVVTMGNPKQHFFHLFSLIDQHLKFPALKKGETGIQVGFDMSSAATSDLFEMSGKVGKNGMVIGIDPDRWNHEMAGKEIARHGYRNIRLIELATYSERTKARFLFGKKPSWSQLGNIAVDETADFTGEETEVQADTMDHIIEEHHIDIHQVGHVNITNNGAEYHTLLGFEKGLREAEDLALTVIAGRYDASGMIEGKPDHERIISYLQSLGYATRFRRIHQLFWWGFCVKLVINRKWVYNKKNYGVIFAVKGKKRIPFYQSFS
jgi:FkbM family methyltransferase